MKDTPPEGLSELLASAVALHKLYATFVEAGFAPSPALTLVGIVLTAAFQQPRPGV